jgi:predicted DNA-binding protein
MLGSNMKKKVFTLYIDSEMLEQLQAWSEETDAPIAAIIRRAIKAALEARKGGKKK